MGRYQPDGKDMGMIIPERNRKVSSNLWQNKDGMTQQNL